MVYDLGADPGAAWKVRLAVAGDGGSRASGNDRVDERRDCFAQRRIDAVLPHELFALARGLLERRGEELLRFNPVRVHRAFVRDRAVFENAADRAQNSGPECAQYYAHVLSL